MSVRRFVGINDDFAKSAEPAARCPGGAHPAALANLNGGSPRTVSRSPHLKATTVLYYRTSDESTFDEIERPNLNNDINPRMLRRDL
jgi:hypothetical protein